MPSVVMLLASTGPEALDQYNQFTFDVASGEDRENHEHVMQKFKDNSNSYR